MQNKTSVAVGISGGIDSAMTAYLLKESGFRVIGITMQTWDQNLTMPKTVKSGCFGPAQQESIQSAARLCQKLEIEHYVVPLQEEFQQRVINYFCQTYLQGKTPNPCLVCNAYLKFALLPQKAKFMGLEFDYFATGHYALLGYNEQLKRYQIKKAKDANKDQSYFLAFLSQEQLAETLFPLGSYTKQEIKNLAADIGFDELVSRKESQDFLQSSDWTALFKPEDYQEGEIVDLSGKVIGTHKGIIKYTIGQRRNLGVSGFHEPRFVLEIDAKRNRIVIGTKENLFKNRCMVTNMNWVSIPAPAKQFRAKAKIRFLHSPADCIVTPINDSEIEVLFTAPQLAITPGQGLVLYLEDLLLGGGFIAFANDENSEHNVYNA